MTSIDLYAVGADSISARSSGRLRVSRGPGMPGPYRVTARKWAIGMNSALISPLRGQLPPRGKPFFVSEYCFLLGERV